MNEHKKFKRSPKKAASFDGIISDGRRLGEPVDRHAVPVTRSYRPGSKEMSAPLGKLDRRADGFHGLRANSQSLGKSPEDLESSALLDEPILLDDEDSTDKKSKKKHYFGNKPSRLRKVLKRSALALLALIILGAAFFGFKIYKTERNLFHGGGEAPALAANVNINQLKGEGDGRVNVLLLGHDGPGYDGADLTDTILLASIDPVNHKAVLLSVPRDLWVKIPGYGSQKINAAYAYGKMYSKSKTLNGQEQDGLNLLDKTLEPILGITINYHVVLDFQAFQQAVDALGGVSINVPSELYDPTIEWQNHYNPVIAKAGLQTMNGNQALLYARSRETSSDFARGQRQRALLVSIKQKALSAGTFSNPIKLSNLLGSLGNNVYTDLSLDNSSRLYQIMSQINSNQISSLDFVTPPHQLVTTAGIDGISVVEPEAGLSDYSDMQEFVRSALPDGFILKENAKTVVYNATTVPGAATSEAALLKTYGYKASTAGDATTTNAQTTILIDLSKGKDKYTRHYLEQRFNVTARTSLPAGSGITPPVGTAFVIIVGEDVASSTQ